MNKLLTAAAVAFPLFVGAAIAAPVTTHQTADVTARHLAQKAGYGVYVPTCEVVIVGYTAWGTPILSRVCG